MTRRAIARIAFVALWSLPAVARAQASPGDDSTRAIITRRASETVERLRRKEFTTATEYFSPATLERLSPQQIKDAWMGLVTALGEPKGIDAVRVDSAATGLTVHVPVRFAAMAVEANLVFDAQQQVKSFSLVPVRKQ